MRIVDSDDSFAANPIARSVAVVVPQLSPIQAIWWALASRAMRLVARWAGALGAAIAQPVRHRAWHGMLLKRRRVAGAKRGIRQS